MFRRDRDHDAELVAAGCRVVRVTWRALREMRVTWRALREKAGETLARLVRLVGERG